METIVIGREQIAGKTFEEVKENVKDQLSVGKKSHSEKKKFTVILEIPFLYEIEAANEEDAGEKAILAAIEELNEQPLEDFQYTIKSIEEMKD